ncbi:hypothetical protein ACQJBY_011778 [Aegilops geniculata]
MLIMDSEEAGSKKERNEEYSINRLPRELIERIFFRLPVSTLLVCIGVCTRWKNLIRDPNFVTSHLKYASHYSLIFFQQDYVAGKLYPSDAILIDKAWSQSTYAVPTIDPDDLLCGSCNGIICLYTKISTIKIANLATGECLHLEKPIKNLSGDQFLFYSFGFHPLTREYKITHLGDYVEGRPKNGDKFTIIQVYRLGDEKWKDIRTPEALSLSCVKNSGLINVGGTMYWLTNDMATNWKHVVMCFDLGEEAFARIELPTTVPENSVYGGPRRYWIREIDGKICIATAQIWHKVIYGKLQIWTLDNKVEQSWSQKYNIHTAGYITGPNLSYGDKLLMQRNDSRLFSHDLHGNEGNIEPMILNMTRLSGFSPVLDFSPRKPDNMQSYIYVESLVRLDVYKKGGIVRNPKKREVWKFKKWKPCEDELSQLEEMWSHIHQKEHDITVFSQRSGIQLKHRLQGISNDVIQQQIGLQIDQIIPVFPNKIPRSSQRLNLVGEKRDREKLLARMRKYGDICKAMNKEIGWIVRMTEIATQYKVGPSSSNDAISSQNHSDNKDTVES